MILAFLAILKSKKSNFNRKSGFLTSSFSDMNDKGTPNPLGCGVIFLFMAELAISSNIIC